MSRLYHKDRSKKLKKEARTIPIPGHIDYGDGEDNGKYYQCWNCSFTCDAERDKLGGIDDSPDVEPKAYTLVGKYGNNLRGGGEGTGTDDNSHSLDALAGTMTGEGYTTYRYKSDVGSGCPLCGTVNWRGDHP
jgi:hypothetical protein